MPSNQQQRKNRSSGLSRPHRRTAEGIGHCDVQLRSTYLDLLTVFVE
jgi:hypothetical protein